MRAERPVAVPPRARAGLDPVAHLLAQDAIYVGGGSMRNMLAIWREHGIDEAMRIAWHRGVRARRAERRRDVLVRGRRVDERRRARAGRRSRAAAREPVGASRRRDASGCRCTARRSRRERCRRATPPTTAPRCCTTARAGRVRRLAAGRARSACGSGRRGRRAGAAARASGCSRVRVRARCGRRCGRRPGRAVESPRRVRAPRAARRAPPLGLTATCGRPPERRTRGPGGAPS